MLSAGDTHGMPSIHASPANCGTLVSVIYIGVVSSFAAHTHRSRKVTEKENRHGNAELQTPWLRYELVCMQPHILQIQT